MNTLIKITNHRYFNLILIATFLLMSLMRILFINADAPQDMSISAAIFTDEGFKTFAARNMMLFGDWKWFTKDLYGNWFLYSPFGTMSYVLVFSFFGIGFSSIKGLSIAYAIATIILLYYYVERYFGKDTAT